MSRLTLSTIVQDGSATNVQALGNISGSFSTSVMAGSYITATAIGSAAWTFTLDSSYVGKSVTWYLRLRNGGATQTFAVDAGSGGVAVDWAGGSAPTLSTSGWDLIKFTYDPIGAYGRLELTNIS